MGDNMTKKGFTLVELLAVLVILGILALIIFPSVSDTLEASRKSAYEKQVKVLETAAEKWGTENIELLPDNFSGEVLAIDFNTLYISGQITEYPVIDPRTGEVLEGCILATYNNQYKQYEFNYSSVTTKCNS